MKRPHEISIPRMNRLCALTLTVAFVLAGCAAPPEEEAEVEPIVAVKVARVREMDIDIRVEAPAMVYPREQANVASRLTARILQLDARKGDSVSAGQVLAHLENRDLAAQRDEAAAAVVDAEATLARVSAGTLPTEVERARGQVDTTKAALDQAQANYDRRNGLFSQGAIPERDLLASRTELATARVNADVAASELRLLESQTGTRDVEIARSRLDQARSRLTLIETQLDYSMIRAPFTGTIIEQFLFPGDMAAPDAPLFTVADLSVAVVRAQVPEFDAANIRVGQACVLAAADRPDGSFSGHLSVVNAAVDSQKRTVEVWCEVANKERGLRGGASGTLAITTATLRGARVVPLSAVQFEEASRHGKVMVVGENRMAKTREVETGVPSGGWVPIRSGLEPGETVIVEGGYGLPDGARVEWTADSQ